MPRYFIEISYNGSRYSGFQVQQNANTIQSEVEKALTICLRQNFSLTCASRTDAGVHALQNFFHFDSEEQLVYKKNSFPNEQDSLKRLVYSLNSILPWDVVIKGLYKVADNAHSRFDATSRTYKYYIYRHKNPFYKDTAYFYPWPLDINMLNRAAEIILDTKDFTSFSKRNTQVNNFFCTVSDSKWIVENDLLIYQVTGNRFLRGMVRGLVGTMLQAGSKKISIQDFTDIINLKDNNKADFSVAAAGLFLFNLKYPFVL